jgi:hypothetical protein
MDFLITVLGNALVQDEFRETLFSDDPVAAAEAWGFRLTKGEGEMLNLIFKGDDAYKEELRARFDSLEDQVYANIRTVFACDRPCKMSVPPPKPLKPLPKAA